MLMKLRGTGLSVGDNEIKQVGVRFIGFCQEQMFGGGAGGGVEGGGCA